MAFYHILVPVIIIAGSLACGSGSQGAKSTEKRDQPELVNEVKYLDNMIQESSGLLWCGGRLWTMNDSGGDPVLFAVDIKTGKAIQAIRISNAKNRDWEELAQDEENIYICDFGNNYGHRDELNIYKIAKKDIPVSGNADIEAEKISFRYIGRDKEKHFQRSAYDCEAAFVYGDSLYIFTKDWETRNTTLYTCPTEPGTYDLPARKTFEIGGLLTGADMDAGTGTVLLCGYRDYVPFIILMTGFDARNYTVQKTQRFDYPSRRNLQTEGVAFVSPARAYVSCEMTEYPAALYSLDLLPYMK